MTTVPQQQCHVLNAPSSSKSKFDDGKPVWIVASSDCQLCAVDLDDPAIVMAGGTSLGPVADRHYSLNEGKLVVLSTKHEVKIDTKYGTVIVPADGAAVISQNDRGVVRMANLGNTPAVFKPVGAVESATVTANSGEEIFLADNTLQDEELIPVDGVDRSLLVEGTITVGSSGANSPEKSLVKSKKFAFDRMSVISKDPALTCSGGCLTVPMKKKVHRLRNDVASLHITNGKNIATKQLPPSKAQTVIKNAPSVLRPVAAVSPAAVPISAPKVRLTSTDAVEVRQLGTDPVHLKRANELEISKGAALISTKERTTIDCGTARVVVEPNSMLHIVNEGGILRVRNLIDSRVRSVRVHVGRHWLEVAPGQEVVLAKSMKEVNFGMTADALPRRLVRQKEIDNAMHCGTAEFSMMALLSNDSLFRAIAFSNRDRDRSIVERLLKMTACIQTITRNHGPYSRPF